MSASLDEQNKAHDDSSSNSDNSADSTALTSYGEQTYDARHDEEAADEGEQSAPVRGILDSIQNLLSVEKTDNYATENPDAER